MPARSIRMLAADVDGTLTIRRGSLLICLEAVRSIRELEERGVRVSLVSGNSLPIVAGLARYFGATGPAVGENGCIILYRERVYHVCEGRPSDELMARLRALGLRESWQNPFRYHDKAFRIPKGMNPRAVLDEVRRLAEREGMRVLWSGYAVHIQPSGGGKGRGVREAARLLGVSLEEVAVIGDGENDLDMFLPETLKGAPGDADPAVRSRADFIAESPGGRGFAEFARFILEGLGKDNPSGASLPYSGRGEE